jgi:hypothetical protein
MRWSLLVGAWVAVSFQVTGAVPTLDHVFPAAVQKGITNTVTLVGKFEPWPPRLWLDGSGVTVEPTTNSGVITVVVAPDAPDGTRFLRAFNEEGASAPRFLIVTSEPQTAEVEPNHEENAPQRIESLPATVNGRLEPSGDVDAFAVSLRAGQTLVAWLEAYTLMSPIDPVLRLVDSQGVQKAWNHDEVGSLDPFLVWTAPTDGMYRVQVFGFAYPADSDIRFTGNARCVYRLHLHGGPVAAYPWPLGVRRGAVTPLVWRGWNRTGDTNAAVEFDGTEIGEGEATVDGKAPGLARALRIPVGEGPEAIEREPNATRETAQAVEVPSAVSGILDEAGDEDRYGFRAAKGQALTLEVLAASLGFPLDAWLRVEDAAGKELARNDDALGADPRLEWTAPDEGAYVAVVGSLVKRYGMDQRYRISFRPTQPRMVATVGENAFSLKPGETNTLSVTLARQSGHAVPLTVTVDGLPDGVSAAPVEVSDKAGDAAVSLVVATNAPAFQGPFQIRVAEKDSGREQRARFSLVSVGENNGVPQGYRRLVRETVSDLWLTVLPPPPPSTNAP